MRQRIIATAVLISLSGVLAGCGGGLSGFDPSDMLDFLDTKKRLAGDRKPVFPEGVPGLEQGVPKDLYKGAQQQPDTADAVAAPPPEPKAKRTARSKSRGQPVAARAAPAAVEPDDTPVAEGSTAAAPPAPKPKRIVRQRTTAPAKEQPQAAQPAPAQGSVQAPPPQQAATPFPAPLPSGSFTR